MPCTPTANEDRQTRKRRRGSLPRSCAECRRLKLRCDRQVPCQSCVKRGCGAICPDGCLTTGQGNRFVLASTEELHDKIQTLAYRIRSLEDGLRDSHARFDSDTHPLLDPTLLAIKAPLQRDMPSKSSRSSSAAPDSFDNNHHFLSPCGSLAFSSASSQEDDDSVSSASSEAASVPLHHSRARPHTPAQNLAGYSQMHPYDSGRYVDPHQFMNMGIMDVHTPPLPAEFFSPSQNPFDMMPMQQFSQQQQQPFPASKPMDPFGANFDIADFQPVDMNWNDLISSVYSSI